MSIASNSVFPKELSFSSILVYVLIKPTFKD